MIETLIQIPRYGPGNPYELCRLGENDFQNPVYKRGVALIDSGKTSVTDAVFIQMWGMAPEGTEVACLSRDIRWDGETEIEGYGEALIKQITGLPVEGKWYGDEYVVLMEGELDPEQLVNNLIYSPAKVYREFLENIPLADAVEADEPEFERDFLYADYAKGDRFIDIMRKARTGQISAVQQRQGRGFVWGYERNAQGRLRAVKPGAEGTSEEDKQDLDAIAAGTNDPKMTENLLDIQDHFIKSSPKQTRWAFKFTLHKTRFCCIVATAAQSVSFGEANFFTTDEFVFNSQELRLNQLEIFGYDIGVVPFLHKKEQEKNKNICSRCKGDKSENECNCDKKEDKN